MLQRHRKTDFPEYPVVRSRPEKHFVLDSMFLHRFGQAYVSFFQVVRLAAVDEDPDVVFLLFRKFFHDGQDVVFEVEGRESFISVLMPGRNGRVENSEKVGVPHRFDEFM